jgi:secreted trypsin-like serine protease
MIKKILLSSMFFSLLSTLIPASAIENGKDATGNSHVVKVVSLYSKTRVSTCSGGVISEYVVVTAAHCLDDESGLLSKEIWILPPGSISKRDSSGAYVRDATWITVDSAQITLTYQNATEKVEDDDLAFLVLSKPVTLNVKTLIPSEDETAKLKANGVSLRLYGYGYISDSGTTIDSPNYYVAKFDALTPTSVKNSGFATSTDATSCQGDSGGPVLNVTPTSVTVVGVITGGPTSIRCGKKQSDGKYYALFTYLSRYANLAFAAASGASKRAIDAAVEAKEEAQAATMQAESDYEDARQEAADALAEVESLTQELDSASARIAELEKIVEELENQIKVLNAKLTKTIICVKGTQTRKVFGLDPKCPKGYKIK